jgi:cysteine synthase A
LRSPTTRPKAASARPPSTSPFLTTGTGGPHRVEGTAAGFWPPHLKQGTYDEVRVIDENDGRAMAKRIAREEGVFAGTSGGVNIVAAINLARELGPGKVVATVAVDTGLKYLAGDLYR